MKFISLKNKKNQLHCIPSIQNKWQRKFNDMLQNIPLIMSAAPLADISHVSYIECQCTDRAQTKPSCEPTYATYQNLFIIQHFLIHNAICRYVVHSMYCHNWHSVTQITDLTGNFVQFSISYRQCYFSSYILFSFFLFCFFLYHFYFVFVFFFNNRSSSSFYFVLI